LAYAPRVRPLVTLTTDFGTRDAYVAEMKGVLLGAGPPDLHIVDLSHDLAPFDVRAAALFVRRALPRFPQRTVHVVVVDPGVGSARNGIVVEVHGQTLVGPDNGTFGLLYDGTERVHVIDTSRIAQGRLSSTFHGRDLFAPVAARLAAGVPTASLGLPTTEYVRWSLPEVRADGARLLGEVIHVDHYGNLVTNITAPQLEGLGERAQLSVECAGARLTGIRDHYAEVGMGELLCLIGSSGQLELSAREASAAELLHSGVGAPVRVWKEA
jgi:S-adenosylmethionine hydrolase